MAEKLRISTDYAISQSGKQRGVKLIGGGEADGVLRALAHDLCLWRVDGAAVEELRVRIQLARAAVSTLFHGGARS